LRVSGTLPDHFHQLRVARGARFFSYSFDGAMLLDGASQAVCQTRDVVGTRLL